MRKLDLFLALIIGEAAALLMVLIGRNLAVENASFAAALPYINLLPFVFPFLCAGGLIAAHFLSRFVPVIYQFAKFVLVGGLNFLIDMGVLNFLVFATGVSTGFVQSGFKALSFFTALVNSYIWNKFWTFKRKSTESVGKEFLQFVVVSAIGFGINVGVDYVFVNMVEPFGGLEPKTWAQFAAMMAAVAALFWNFIGYKFIVFDQKKNEQNRAVPQIQA